MRTVKAEQTRRRLLRYPMHYWRERGDEHAPREEFWCDYCVAFYGVPHGHTNVPCRDAYRQPRQCACIDCVVGSEASCLTR